MTLANVKDLKKQLVDAGFEVFRVRDDEVHLAERQNLHLMEAGVRVRFGTALTVIVVGRSQRSDAPSLDPTAQFNAVRRSLAPLITTGYRELSATPREVRSVSDPDQILDLWFEVTVALEATDIDQVTSELKKVLQLERNVVPTKQESA